MSSPADRTKIFISVFRAVAGVALIAIGGTAVCGWYFGQPLMTSFYEGLPPMHFVAAVCFILGGIALLAETVKARFVSLCVSILLCLVALFEVLETSLGFRLHGATEIGLGSEVGHYFHATLIGGFVFFFLGWGIISKRWKHTMGLIMSGSSGAFVVSCGIATLIGLSTGYAAAINWGNLTEISLPGAIAFVFAGCALVLGTIRSGPKSKLKISSFISVTVLVISLTLTFLARQQLYIQEITRINQTVAVERRNLGESVQYEVDRRVLANERMASRWASNGGSSREQWERDALNYIRDYGAYQAIEWVGPDNRVEWVVPLETNTEAVGFDLSEEKNRRDALERAKESRRTSVSNPVNLVQGGVGLLAFSPIYRDDEFMGFILGVFQVDELLSSTLPTTVKNSYSVTFTDTAGRQIFASDSPRRSRMDQNGRVRIADKYFTFRIRPKHAVMAAFGTANENLALLAGTIISLLLSGAVFLAQRARRHENVTKSANLALKSEIDTRKQIEDQLRETSTFREAILNGASYLIISTDPEGTITSFNRAAEIHTGYDAEEVIGTKNLEELLVDSEIEEHTEELRRKYGYRLDPGFDSLAMRARDNITEESDWTVIRENGAQFPVTLSMTAIFDEFGSVKGYIAIARDNSRLYATSRRLAESEERFKTVVNNTPALIYMKDREGRFVFSNSKFEEILGMEPGSLIGKTVFDLTDRKTAERIWAQESRVVTTGVPEESSEPVVLGDEILAQYLFTRFAVPTLSGENILGVIAIDLSAQLAVEEDLRTANRAAVESNRMKSEFLANMSHEIRTPMNGVLGMLEVLLETELNTSQREYSEVIQDSAKTLLTILDDILDFSKLEAGKLTFESIEFDLRPTVENTVALFTEQAETKDIELTYLIEPNVPKSLQGDPGRLRQVLTNLVGNAVKFTEKGEVTISVSCDEQDGENAALRFKVADTGIGISEDAQKHLFEAFVQADGSMVRKYGGTGLGLSISRQLVEMMNGRISVVSEPDVGSQFTFTAVFGVPAETEETKPIAALEGLKVLIVDDLEVNRKGIAYQLEGLGVTTFSAYDGEECMAMLQEHSEREEPFDVILLDLEMPGLDGFETAELINASDTIERPHIVIMPSNGKRGHARDAMRRGVSAYLIKPVRQVELFDCLSILMGRAERTKLAGADSEESLGLITRHSMMDKRGEHGAPVLVASGNIRSQSVLSMQLELLGYRSEVVSDSDETVLALKRRDYPVVLLDLDLPEDGGVHTTERITAMSSRNAPKIVGFTDRAVMRERKSALAAGMARYVELPFSEETLVSALEEEEAALESDVPKNGKQRSETGPESIEQMVRRNVEEIGEDMTSMKISLFAEDSARHADEISDALGSGDFDEIVGLTLSMRELVETIELPSLLKKIESLQRAASTNEAELTARANGEFRVELEDVLLKLEENMPEPATV